MITHVVRLAKRLQKSLTGRTRSVGGNLKANTTAEDNIPYILPFSKGEVKKARAKDEILKRY